MHKVRRRLPWILAAALVIAGAFLWTAWEKPVKLVLASTYAQQGALAVQVQRFEMAWDEPGPLAIRPPNWMAKYPMMLKTWAWVFRTSRPVMDGLVWVFVEARVSTNQPLEAKDVEYRLDYGEYTIGVNGGSISSQPGRPYQVSTRFELTEGPIPIALEIRVKDQWFRFPIQKQ